MIESLGNTPIDKIDKKVWRRYETEDKTGRQKTWSITEPFTKLTGEFKRYYGRRSRS